MTGAGRGSSGRCPARATVSWPRSASPSKPRAPIAVVFARHSLSALVELVLRHCGIERQVTASAPRVRELVRQHRPVLLIVDVGRGPVAARLVGLAGGADRATIALIDLDRGASSRTAFGLGADQVVRMPFTPDELAVRAAQVLRRLGLATPFVRNIERSLARRERSASCRGHPRGRDRTGAGATARLRVEASDDDTS